MTKEKAIERLQTELSEYEPYIETYEGAKLDCKALNMAIKALEQEETDKDTDFVPIEIEFMGKKGCGYLYKPQQLIVTGYWTLEAFKHFGGKYKEKEEEGND